MQSCVKNRQRLKVGVISDTHGLLRPEARAFRPLRHHRARGRCGRSRCGPRRFKLPISAAELDIGDGAVSPRTVQLL
jgi:hypothetical protein